ncbi:hypothetical protein CORC01_09907 [Colletotrichum orchidophilum]|uniref:Uncharacterized protein n=1 Tax=Colletotrichum orchidophilum TaxID=1209926 RepID=A0A1G4B049_9PEZI|nr:uncharacterized protein CORC01_09907 [Colletotrichum orchidophilum]OHE94800.1 hypothetical protein CORC01_09907 [Colletotrichum orchidophilum]
MRRSSLLRTLNIQTVNSKPILASHYLPFFLTIPQLYISCVPYSCMVLRDACRETAQDGTLGIDFGSTSTRIFLWCPERKEEIDIENPGRPRSSEYPVGDFSSVGYPFEQFGSVYLGNDPDPLRQPISLKYAFYALVNLAESERRDNMIDQYVMVSPLLARRADPAFRDRLRSGLVALFSTLHGRVTEICALYRLKVTIIGISIPSQWTLDFEEVYGGIVAEVFGHPRQDISFHTETEALAHVLLRKHQVILGTGDDLRDRYSVFLFLDFGGHNMNGCVFNVAYSAAGHMSYYRFGKPFGAGGGSEQWSYHVGEHFVKLWHRQKKRKPSPQEVNRFMGHFNQLKASLGPGGDYDRLDTSIVGLELDPADINECFEISHKNGMEEAKRQIKTVSIIENAEPFVIVSGGTAEHRVVRDRLRSFCDSCNLPAPGFTGEWSLRHGSGKIARGVAFAAGRLTFAQGFQDRWVPLATGTGKDRFKIICDPFFDADQGPEPLYYDTCYDFLHLGNLKKGRWKLWFSLVRTQDSTLLVLKGRRTYGRGPKRKTAETSTNPLKLYFDGGANCYFVDKTDFDINNFRECKPSRSPEDLRQARLQGLDKPDAGIIYTEDEAEADHPEPQSPVVSEAEVDHPGPQTPVLPEVQVDYPDPQPPVPSEDQVEFPDGIEDHPMSFTNAVFALDSMSNQPHVNSPTLSHRFGRQEEQAPEASMSIWTPFTWNNWSFTNGRTTAAASQLSGEAASRFNHPSGSTSLQRPPNKSTITQRGLKTQPPRALKKPCFGISGDSDSDELSDSGGN